MIPRAARRLETTLLSSFQSLPCHARLYSTPSKPVKAPALATAQVLRPDFPAFLSSPSPERPLDGMPSLSNDMGGFLKRKAPYTILPTPLPDDRSSDTNNFWFIDSPTQDLLAVMDACLHNLYDVPRAKNIFERLRNNSNSPVLETRVYNAFLEAYINMASTKEPDNRSFWIETAWELYDIMEHGRELVKPSAGTYAIMLIAWHRFNPESSMPVATAAAQTPLTLLTNIVDRQISIPFVISDRVFVSSEEAADIIKLISKAAVDLNLSRVISELGQAEAIGQHPDPLEGVPEAMPVTRIKKKATDDISAKETDVSELEEGVERNDGPEFEVPFNLDNLRHHLAQVAFARRVLPEDVVSRQKLLEESVYDVAVERLKHHADIFAELGLGNNSLMQADLQRWMWEWHTKLKARLEVEIRAIAAAEKRIVRGKVHLLSPFLALVKAERLSLITILEIMRLQGSGGLSSGMKTTRALVAVGKAVEIEYKAQMCKKNNIPIPSTSRIGDTGYFNRFGYQDLHARRVAVRKFMEDGEQWTSLWTQATRAKVGSILVECLMDVAEVTRTTLDKETKETISEVQPAFYHSYEYQRGQKLGVIRLNPVVADRIAMDGVRETLHPRHLPMLVKPKPWLNHDQGGYLYNKTSAMRFKDSLEQQSYLKHASSLGNVELVYAGLDVLGSTPWKINKKIFDVVLQVWNSGKRMGKLPPAVYDEPEPVPPENYGTDLKARSIHLQRQQGYVQAKANNHSERCSVNYKIEIARAFLGDTIYLPHNLDFRGRAYPIPPHLNHIGDDLSRGLLMFGESKPLGVRGLRWLKIHLANLYGYDKANFDERVNFVMERLDDIYDSATNPLTGRQWWTKADDPWQCLATCMDLHAALESGDPHAYRSSLPIHQDGTCNGLQHYAALGGDDQGAKQVNLSAAERPSDVYTYVGNMVEKMLEEDVAKGDKYAKMLLGKITRKVVKQTVMTTVYGVTFVGARDQIERQLKDKKDIPEEECWPAASYLAKKTLSCISDLFSGARAIQTWLNLCARLIAKSIPEERLPEAMAEHKPKTRRSTTNKLPTDRLKKEQMTSVVWTTPLGLPIVQPYRKTNRKQIMTSLQSVYISDPNSPAEVNSLKQASAFPPNFIHSLDATHMMLTALECRTQSLTFASVHDSYWTHASSIDKMSEIIRETFIALHSSDVLGKLQAEFLERYKGYKVPLVNLRTGHLMKQLCDAGSQIVATPEQAKSLAAIAGLLNVSETETPTVDESEAPKIIGNYANLVANGEKPSTKEARGQLVDSVKLNVTSEMQNLVDTLVGDQPAEDEWESQRIKTARKKKAEDQTAIELLGKFVNLTDILPPLPKKGGFQVETIKSSQYFFS